MKQISTVYRAAYRIETEHYKTYLKLNTHNHRNLRTRFSIHSNCHALSWKPFSIEVWSLQAKNLIKQSPFGIKLSMPKYWISLEGLNVFSSIILELNMNKCNHCIMNTIKKYPNYNILNPLCKYVFKVL